MIAVLITVHNRIEKTVRCLKQLKQAALRITIPVDIYLVDDASTDGTSERLEEEYPDVRVIQGNGELFWNRGMRLAWKTATAVHDFEYYLWLNNDTYLKTNALDTLLEHSIRMKNKSIICGQTNSETTGEMTYGGELKSGRDVYYEGGLSLCDFINGNCVLIPKFVYERNGLLDKQFHHSLGDFDYSLRAAKLGINSYLTEDSLAYCEPNPRPWLWCRKDVPLNIRLKHLYSPGGGNPPHIHFKYEKRHFGLIYASFHYLTMHIRVLFPTLWANH